MAYDFGDGLKMKHITILLDTFFLLVACNQNNKKGEQINLSNKEKVVALLNSIETGNQTAVSYINAKEYTQHNLSISDGLEGFGAMLKLMLYAALKKVIMCLHTRIIISLVF